MRADSQGELTRPGGVSGAEAPKSPQKARGGARPGVSAAEDGREAPLERPGLDAPLGPASRDPRRLKPRPRHRARAGRRGEGHPAGGGGRGRGEARARASLAAGARAARSRRPRRHLFPLRLSVCRWLCPSAAPPLGSPPSARPSAALRLPGPSPGEPRPGRPELQPGAHCPAVRLSGGGAQGPGAPRSAEAPGKKDPRLLPSGARPRMRGPLTASPPRATGCWSFVRIWGGD